jgi:histidinol dehydrogenase
MPKYLKTSSKNFEKEFYDILENKAELSEEVDIAVRRIVKEVRAKGDTALINYTNKFDINKLTIETIKISLDEIDNIFDKCDKETIEALLFAYKRIYAHHSKNLPKDHQYIDELGVELGTRWTPIESVGIYVPGGKANYPSSVLMNAVPAIVAGASRIAMAVPSMNDNLNPLVIAAAKICGITEIYKIGGAQAIAALAYGTETIEAVDLIVGPGNKYVAAAKKQVFGKVGIDMIAGPSELLVIGDSESNVNWIAADLIAQAEHDEEAQSIFVTTNREIAKQVDKAVASLLENNLKDSIANKSWKNKGVIILCNSDQEIVNIVNKIAPEHLELNVNNV